MTISHLALGAALALSAAPALAEAETESRDHAPADRNILVTGHRAADEAKAKADSTPGGTDVVTHDDYADKSLVSLRDALAFSPGVYLQPRYGQEVRISIRGSGLSRGFHMRGITLLQDGVPINLADDNGDFQELEPTFFDHLEVYRGANALRFGSGTLGGAINGVTPTGRTSDGLYLRGDAGSFDTYRGMVSFGGVKRTGRMSGQRSATITPMVTATMHAAIRRAFTGTPVSRSPTISKTTPTPASTPSIRRFPEHLPWQRSDSPEDRQLRWRSGARHRFAPASEPHPHYLHQRAARCRYLRQRQIADHPIFQVVDQELPITGSMRGSIMPVGHSN